MIAEKGHAGAEAPFPGDHRGPAFDKRAEVNAFIKMTAGIARGFYPADGPVERLPSQIIQVHSGQLQSCALQGPPPRAGFHRPLI